MARVRMIHGWGDNENRQTVEVTVEVASSYPDAVNQARAECGRGFAEALLLVLDADRVDDADDE